MIVTREHHERCLAQVARRVGDPRTGIYGPHSPGWWLNGQTLSFLGGGRAALLQVAHPYVAQAIVDHSITHTDMWGRFARTFSNVFAMTFGDLEEAFTSARHVFAVHTRIHGTLDEDIGGYPRGHRYAATESSALMWVHATLIDTVITVQAAAGRPIPTGELHHFYEETVKFGLLFGIPIEEIPDSYPEFSRYMRDMLTSGTIEVGRAARSIAGMLFDTGPAVMRPAWRAYRWLTAGLLPAAVRDAFGLPFGAADRLALKATLAAVRAGVGSLPRSLRYLPAFTEGLARLDAGPVSRGGALPGLRDRLAVRAQKTVMPRY